MKDAAILNRFNHLQWKLTISYMITSVIVLCLLELLVVLFGLIVAQTQEHDRLGNDAQRLARSTGPAMLVTEVEQQRLQALWQLNHDGDSTLQGYLSALDTRGRVMVSAGDAAPTPGSMLPPQLPVQIQRHMQEMLARGAPVPLTSWSQSVQLIYEQNATYALAPLLTDDTIQGVIVVKLYPGRSALWRDLLLFFAVSALVFFIGAGLVGLAFGVVTARGLVRRLQSIAGTVDGWSRGDFSFFIHDASRDELGQLARRLNQMAQQLQQLLRTRQDLATIEERQRLARDLHDSVKQQVFAVSLHISTTRALMERNPAAAQTQLGKAEQLIRQAQRELTTLIRELRPVGLEGRSLVDAIRQHTHSWQEQTGIPIELKLDIHVHIPLAVENALFRIIQEGLSNVERHSQATSVRLSLSSVDDAIRLIIDDNGQGFDERNQGHHGVGLSSMRERVQALGGQIQIQSQVASGTSIIISIFVDGLV